MIAMKEIQDLSRRIADTYDPEKIILFGSYARGTATEDSDVDLLVILPFEGKSFWKSWEILSRMKVPFSIDLLARHPADVARRYVEGDPLIREAIDQGSVLYEQRRQGMD